MSSRTLSILPMLALALLVSCGGDDAGTPADSAGPDTTTPDTATPDVEVAPEPVPLPALVAADPADGAREVPTSAWLVLTFDGGIAEEMLLSFTLTCANAPLAVTAEALGADRVLVNPAAPLPSSGSCRVAWLGPDGEAATSFSVAAAGEPAVVPYDRDDFSLLAPFPDDTLLTADDTTATGRRVALPVPDRPEDVVSLFAAISEVPSTLDGWSPLAPLVVALPAAVDARSIPLTAAASLDPLASVGLFDIDPASRTYRQRVAFDLIVKEELDADGTPSHVWVIFPSAPLEPRGQYALVVTRRALVDATRPLAPSPYMTRVAINPATPAGTAVFRLSKAVPAMRSDDVALVLALSVRSVERIPDDLMAVRQAVRAAAPPAFEVTEVVPDSVPGSPIAAIVRGTWQAPSWRDGDYFARDEAGRPRQTGTVAVPFVLALPERADAAPLIMYQHGQPGSAEEILLEARRGLAADGFAVIGFTNIANRDIIKGSGDTSLFTNLIFIDLLQQRRFTDLIASLDNAEQLSFLRLLPTLGELDVLPLETPDGEPDLDVAAPLGYLGISHGSHEGTGLLAFAPEIKAAALVVGGGRWSTTVVHQESDGPNPLHLYELVSGVFTHITHAELWVGIALSQMGVDEQDWLMRARSLYREPLALETAARPSVLLIEGLGDSFVPASSTRAAAAAFGIPQLDPVPDPVPFLAHIQGPVLSNTLDGTATAAFVQYVPDGYPGITATPGCAGQIEGHFCAQGAAEARALRSAFFRSALGGVPIIGGGE